MAEALVKADKKILYRFDSRLSLVIVDRRRPGFIDTVEIAEIDNGAKEYAADGPAGRNGSHVAGRRPLVGAGVPAFDFPQHLQDSFGSGISIGHQPDALFPLNLQFFIGHRLLPSLFFFLFR